MDWAIGEKELKSYLEGKQACQIMALVFHGLRVLSLIMIGITIFGINDASLSDLLGVLAAAMFIPLLLLIFGGFACDIQK